MKRETPEQKAKEFRKKYGIRNVSAASLKAALAKQGFTVVEFNHAYNNEDVTTLIRSLHLSEQIAHSKGFTCVSANYRLVFLHDSLSEKEQATILAHEQGHISFRHFSAGVMGQDILEEAAANEFAHYLLHPASNRKAGVFAASLAATALLCGGIFFFVGKASAENAVLPADAPLVTKEEADAPAAEKNPAAERSVPETVSGTAEEELTQYYILPTGNRYHEKECLFVKDKTTARCMTRKELESGNFERCQTCLPPEEETLPRTAETSAENKTVK